MCAFRSALAFRSFFFPDLLHSAPQAVHDSVLHALPQSPATHDLSIHALKNSTMFYLTLLAFLVSFVPSFVSAGFSLTSPTAGESIAAASGVTLKFTDDGDAPSFADISSTKVLLCTGSNADINCLATVATFTPSKGTSSFAVPLASYTALGSNGPYFFQLYSVATGGYAIQYSPRFTLSGMTGSIRATNGGDTSPPADQIQIVGATDAGPETAALGASFSLPYTAQTGVSRYAPMQMQPGSKVTHKLSASRRFPTSSVSFFTTFTMQPLQKTTSTPPWSYSITQGMNFAETQASPTGYYAASEALSRNILAKSRRGYIDL